MFNRLTLLALCLVVLGAAVAWILSAPRPLDAEQLANLPVGSAVAGEQVFYAGGCSSCHAAPKSEGEDKLKMAGGHEFETPFGTFVAPNISPHETAGLNAGT